MNKGIMIIIGLLFFIGLVSAGAGTILQLGSDLLPLWDNVVNLGSPNNRYNDAYLVDTNISDNLYVGNPTTPFYIYNKDTNKEIVISANVNGTDRNVFVIHSATGAISTPKQSAVFAYLNAAGGQTISNVTYTVVDFDGERFDNLDEFDLTTNTFTAKNAGKYLVLAHVLWANTNANVPYTLIPWKGADTDYFQDYHHPAGAYSYMPNIVAYIVELNKDQNFAVRVYQTSGGNETLVGAANTYITILKVV